MTGQVWHGVTVDDIAAQIAAHVIEQDPDLSAGADVPDELAAEIGEQAGRAFIRATNISNRCSDIHVQMEAVAVLTAERRAGEFLNQYRAHLEERDDHLAAQIALTLAPPLGVIYRARPSPSWHCPALDLAARFAARL